MRLPSNASRGRRFPFSSTVETSGAVMSRKVLAPGSRHRNWMRDSEPKFVSPVRSRVTSYRRSWMSLARARASSRSRLLSPAKPVSLPDPHPCRVEVQLVQGAVRIVGRAVRVVGPHVIEAAGLEGQTLVVAVVDPVVRPVVVGDPAADPAVGEEGDPTVLAHACIDRDVVVGNAV